MRRSSTSCSWQKHSLCVSPVLTGASRYVAPSGTQWHLLSLRSVLSCCACQFMMAQRPLQTASKAHRHSHSHSHRHSHRHRHRHRHRHKHTNIHTHTRVVVCIALVCCGMLQGRYSFLTLLVPVIGSDHLLALAPALTQDLILCCHVNTLVKAGLAVYTACIKV